VKRYRVKYAVGPHDDRLAKAVGYCVALGEPDSMLLVEVSPYVWDDFARQGDRSKTGAFTRDPKEAALRHGVGGRLVVIRAVADTKDITASGSKFSVAIAECAAPVINEPLVDLEELDPTESTDSESDEFSNFLGDIEALIPADCRNSIAGRLQSVRAAVGLLAQKVAGSGAAGAEAWAWVSNAPYGGSVLPTPAPSAKDGPTEKQCQEFLDRAYGYGTIALSHDMLRSFTFCWQAAREGMVPLEQYENAFSHWEAIRIELTATQDELRVCKSVRDTAERRVGELERQATELEKMNEAYAAKRDELRVELKSTNSELERVKAELAGWKEWSKPHGFDTIQADVARLRNNERELGELFRALGLGLNASDTLESTFATIRGWRDATTAPASDEVTEEEARALHDELRSKFDEGGHEWDDLEPYQQERDRHLIRLARRNHRAQQSKIPGELTEAQREELAGAVYQIAYPITAPAKPWFKSPPDLRGNCFAVVDAIAPRIARVGVELLSVPRERLLQLAITNNRSPDYTGGHARAAFNWEQFAADVLNEARAILAAAQGGAVVERDMKPENSRKSVSHFDRATHYLNGLSDGDSILVKRDRLIAEFADVEQRAIPQPPRGRKLTDGEREKLLQFARCWADAESAGASREDSDNFVTFVESLLAPQELETPRKHTPFSELFHKLWGQAHGKEYNKALWVQAHEMLLAPQDEVRVALGVCELQGVDWNRAIHNKSAYPYPFGNPLQREITQALSASTGDKFDFSVVARRVEK
jgi:hypothetical protein